MNTDGQHAARPSARVRGLRGLRRRLEPLRGFLVFVWYAVLWLPRVLVRSLVDDGLVLLRLKWRPATGEPRWRWDRPRPDPAAAAWQDRIRPTPTRTRSP